MVHPASCRIGLVAVLLAVMALAGCGRKGPLELPPNAPTTLSPAETAAQENRVQPLTDDPGLIQPPNKVTERPASEKLQQAVQNPSRPINGPERQTGKRFILDPLL